MTFLGGAYVIANIMKCYIFMAETRSPDSLEVFSKTTHWYRTIIKKERSSPELGIDRSSLLLSRQGCQLFRMVPARLWSPSTFSTLAATSNLTFWRSDASTAFL